MHCFCVFYKLYQYLMLLFQLPVICSAYTLYAQGLIHAASLIGSLEKNDQFCGFLLNVSQQGRELSLCDFINRPLVHIQELCGLLQIISSTTMPHSEERAMFFHILQGKFICYFILPLFLAKYFVLCEQSFKKE